MNQEIVKEAIEYILANNWVSFPELLHLLEKSGVETKGNMGMHHLGDPNLIYWTGMSDDALDIIDAIKKTGDIPLLSGAVLAYMADGAVQNLPLAKRLQPGGFKKPHWVPMFFCRPGTQQTPPKKKGKNR